MISSLLPVVCRWWVRLYLSWLLLVTFLVQPYRIRQHSMEPTMMGEAEGEHLLRCPAPQLHRALGGDIVLTAKFLPARNEVDRFELLLFRFPLNPNRVMAKRVVGLPGDEIKIEGGDLWIKSGGRWERISKPPTVQRRLWVRISGPFPSADDGAARDWNFLGAARVEGDWVFLPPGGQMRFRHVPRWGTRQVEDLCLSAAVLPEDKASIVARLGGCRLELGTRESWFEAGGKRVLIGIRLPPGRESFMELWRSDGVMRLWLNGREIHTAPGTDRADRGIEIGVHGAAARLRRVVLSRDVIWMAGNSGNFREGDMIRVPSGRYFLLGDNSMESRDSRFWRRVVITLVDGKEIECERSALVRSERNWRVEGDVSGRRWEFPSEMVQGEKEEPFPWIDGRYIVGKPFLVVWPRGRIGVPVR